jgi:Domain of unknown function (DUF4112)
MASAPLSSVRISDKQTLEWSTADESAARKSAADVERLAHWLDTLIEIPGIRVRFGIDALLGLLPGVGDTASALASVYILRAASGFGVPRITLARMTLNIAVDLLVGAVPILGDMFDLYWKANRKNVELLRHHLKANPTMQRKLTRSDGLFVAGMIAVVGAILVGSIAGAYFLISKAVQLLPSI